MPTRPQHSTLDGRRVEDVVGDGPTVVNENGATVGVEGLSDEEITTVPTGGGGLVAQDGDATDTADGDAGDADGTDAGDGDAGDGDAKDATDGDSSDSDGADADGTDA